MNKNVQTAKHVEVIEKRKILFIAGKPSHGNGEHEFRMLVQMQ